ncbi:MAG: sigma-70 family RNA polymerase sigma factor [Opitutus sp.]
MAEIQLLARIGVGDRVAFRELYGLYSAPLFAFAVRLVNDRSAAEELLQDSFVKIWRHANGYDPRKSRPFTWAVTILRRTCIDYLRRHRAAPTLIPLATEVDRSSEFATKETPRRFAVSSETSHQVQDALAEISPDQRQALELALYSELTHAEIARQLNQPIGTIKTWIRRGLLDLRTTLAKP